LENCRCIVPNFNMTNSFKYSCEYRPKHSPVRVPAYNLVPDPQISVEIFTNQLSRTKRVSVAGVCRLQPGPGRQK
jgi:hypothetical protein